MRWIFRTLAALVVIALLATGALFTLPTDRIADLATQRIATSLGREVRLTGEVRPRLWPYLGIRAEGVFIGNPDWVDGGPLIAAEALSVRVPWSAVVARAVSVDEITLVSPDITLVRAADGRTSWDFSSGQAPPSTPAAESDTAGVTSFSISAVRIEGGRLVFRDEGSGHTFTLSDVEADLAMPATAPASVAMTAVLNGTELSLDATMGDLDALIAGAISPVTTSLEWSAGALSLDGQMSLAPALSGAISVDASDFSPLAAILDRDIPDLPEGYGRERVALSGNITLASEGSTHLRDGRLTLDETELALALDILPGDDRPLIRGAITGARLAVPDMDGADAPASGGAGAGAGWSTAPIDVSGLFAADVELALAVEVIEAAGLQVGPVDLRATLTNGRMVFDIDRMGTYGGTLAGQFVVNGRNGLSVGGDLILAGVQLSPLLSDLADYDRLSGTGSASAQFLGVGNDMATIMSSLSGQGDLSFGAGAIAGFDLAGMIRNFDTSFRGEGQSTVYDSVSANFTVANGVLSNDDLRLDAPWGEVTGAGTVDLGRQTLDYRVIPGVLRGQDDVASIRVPVLISGPWANPSIRPDLEYLAQQELAQQAEQLEAEARERLATEADRLEAEARARANDVLGTNLQDGATLDDAGEALEDRLVDEAQNQLLRLLGRD